MKIYSRITFNIIQLSLAIITECFGFHEEQAEVRRRNLNKLYILTIFYCPSKIMIPVYRYRYTTIFAKLNGYFVTNCFFHTNNSCTLREIDIT